MYIDFLASLILGSALVYSARLMAKETAQLRADITKGLQRVEAAVDRQTAMLNADELELDLKVNEN